jgi:hypothetical protein
MMVDSGAGIYPLESALGVYRAPPAAQEAYQFVKITSEIKVKRTRLLEIKLDNNCPRRVVNLSVPKRRWYSHSKFDQGALVEKNTASFFLASSYVIPSRIS